MFNNKFNLMSSGEKPKTNSFLDAGDELTAGTKKEEAKTRSGNLSLKFSTTGNPFVDQFGNASAYIEERPFDEIAHDCNELWAEDPNTTVRFILYLRMITRKTDLFSGEKMDHVSRGQGLKHEGLSRMLWLYFRDEQAFWDNLLLYISVSSWKDIFTMLRRDLMSHGWDERKLDWDKFYDIISIGLQSEQHTDLIRKYLPHIKSASNQTTQWNTAGTIIGKWLCYKLNISYKQYRLMKKDGEAHTWQQLISQQRFDEIKFSEIHGKALRILVSGKFLENQGLENKYLEWIEKQEVAKFNGYPFELFTSLSWSTPDYKKITINKQFMNLVKTAKEGTKDEERLIVVRDTSGSMGSPANGTPVSCYDIAKGLALFFSHLLEGAFKSSWIEFNHRAILHHWRGSTPVENWLNDTSDTIGNTNFLSVADLFVRIKDSNVPEDEFPTGIVCISDGEFDPDYVMDQTNHEAFKRIMRQAGFSKKFVSDFKFIFWNLRNRYYFRNEQKFETYGDVDNAFYFSGFDGSSLAFITGIDYGDKAIKEPKNAAELVVAALSQPILELVTV